MVTYQAFVDEFGEFDQLDHSVVEAKIAEAQRSFDVELFGTRYDDAVKYKAAILLMSVPGGRPMALTKDKATPYDACLQAIVDGIPGRGLLLCPE